MAVATPMTQTDVVYVATFAPIVAHIQHPLMADRTRCGCRVRWWLRPHQVEAMGVCYECERDLASEEGDRVA